MGSWNSMQTTTDDTSLAFCQMMQAKDVQIRRLVLRMERCATAPVKPTATACQHAELLLCWPAPSLRGQRTLWRSRACGQERLQVHVALGSLASRWTLWRTAVQGSRQRPPRC